MKLIILSRIRLWRRFRFVYLSGVGSAFEALELDEVVASYLNMGVELFLLQVLGLLVLCLLARSVEDEVGNLVGAFLVETDCDLLVDSFGRSCGRMELTDVVDEYG